MGEEKKEGQMQGQCVHHRDMVGTFDRLSDSLSRISQQEREHQTEIRHLIDGNKETKDLIMDLKQCFHDCMKNVVSRDNCIATHKDIDGKFGNVYKHSNAGDKELKAEFEKEMLYLRQDMHRNEQNLRQDIQTDKKTFLAIITIMITIALGAVELVKWIITTLT